MNGFLYALSIAHPSPIPYIAALILLTILLIILVAKVPTLRNLRKKQTLLTYVAAALVFGLLTFQAYDAALGATVFTSSIDPSDSGYKTGTLNHFNISVTNLGHRAATFYLTLNSVNASLQVQNQPDYIQVNSTTLKIPFSIPGAFRYQESKSVFFTIDENVTSFSINDNDYSITRVAWTTQMKCRWNSTDNSYSIIGFSEGPT